MRPDVAPLPAARGSAGADKRASAERFERVVTQYEPAVAAVRMVLTARRRI